MNILTTYTKRIIAITNNTSFTVVNTILNMNFNIKNTINATIIPVTISSNNIPPLKKL